MSWREVRGGVAMCRGVAMWRGCGYGEGCDYMEGLIRGWGVISLALGMVLSETCVCTSSNEPCNRFRIMGNITDDANLTLRLHTLGKFPINIINNKYLAGQGPSRRDVACCEALQVEPCSSGPQDDGLASSC